MNVRRNIENITKADRNFAPNFVDHHVLPDDNVNSVFKNDRFLMSFQVFKSYIATIKTLEKTSETGRV